MGAEDIALADRLIEAVDGDDREAVYGLFSDDIEYVTDRRTLRGIDELRDKLSWEWAEGRTRRRVRKGQMEWTWATASRRTSEWSCVGRRTARLPTERRATSTFASVMGRSTATSGA